MAFDPRAHLMSLCASTVRQMRRRNEASALDQADAKRMLDLLARVLEAENDPGTAIVPANPVPATRAPAKGNHRLPEGWLPSEATQAYAATRAPEVDLHGELEKFQNHFHSLSGSRAAKSDWDLAFRNWLLRARDDHRPRGSGTARQSRDEKRERIVRAAASGSLDDVL